MTRLATRLTIFLLLAITSFALSAATTAEKPSASILLYHHVADDTPRSTSVTPDVFAKHLAYIDKHHTVVPLKAAVDAITNGGSLPDNAVVITFDDGYDNILTNAHPILRKYKMPYTIFINPDAIGVQKNQLTWDEVRKMQKEDVLFANHTLDHLHMLNRQPDESSAQWLERVWRNVEEAEAKIAEQTGTSVKYLAYPFGEFNSELANELKKHGYIGFGQHSGAAGTYSDTAAIPRFPAAGPYANLDSLKTKMASLAMPVTHNTIDNPEVTSSQLHTNMTLTVSGDDVSLNQTSCFFNGEQLDVKQEDKAITVTLELDLPVGRSRINCTAPSKSMSGRYYWYSQPFFLANSAGKYPN